MKKLFFITVLGLLTIQTNVSVANSVTAMAAKETKESIQVKLIGGIVRFGVTKPIELYQNSNNLQLIFNKPSGNLNIVITKSNGSVVYQRSVNAAEGTTLTISTYGWSSGSYTIRITDADDFTREGVFEIE